MRGTRWRPRVVVTNPPLTAQSSVEDALQVVLATDAQLGAVIGHASAYPAEQFPLAQPTTGAAGRMWLATVRTPRPRTARPSPRSWAFKRTTPDWHVGEDACRPSH